jgi:hypothetical protein
MDLESSKATFIRSVLNDCRKVIEELCSDSEEESWYVDLLNDIEESLDHLR